MIRAKRVTISSNVIINRTIAGEGLDLSEGGMYVYSRAVLTPESIVEIGFDLDGEHVMLEGIVRHLQPGIGFGVKFVDVPVGIAAKIRAYLSSSGKP